MRSTTRTASIMAQKSGQGKRSVWARWAARLGSRLTANVSVEAPLSIVHQLLQNVLAVSRGPVTAFSWPHPAPEGAQRWALGEVSSCSALRLLHTEALPALGRSFHIVIMGSGYLKGVWEFVYLTKSVYFSSCTAPRPACWKLIDCLAWGEKTIRFSPTHQP